MRQIVGEDVSPEPTANAKSIAGAHTKDDKPSDFAIKAVTMILAAEEGSFPGELDVDDNFHHVEEENGDDLDDGLSSDDSDEDEFPDPYDQKRLEAIPRGAICTIAMNRMFRDRLKHLLGKNHFDFVVSVSRKAFAARKAVLKGTSAYFSQIGDGEDSFDIDMDIDTEALGSLFKILHNVTTRMKVEELDAAVDLARELEVHALHDFDLLSVMPEMRGPNPPIGKALTPSGILFEQNTFSKPLPPGLGAKRKRPNESTCPSPEGKQPSAKRQKLTRLLSPMSIPPTPKNMMSPTLSESSLPDCCKNNTVCVARHILRRFGLRVNSSKLATRVDLNCEPSRGAIEAFRKKHQELVEIVYKLVGRKMRQETVEATGMLLRGHAVIVAAQSHMRLRDGVETGSLSEAEAKLLSMERLVNQLLLKKDDDDEAKVVEYLETTYLAKNAAKRRDKNRIRNVL